MSLVRQFQVTFDCAEPERGARFWCEALGYVVPPPPEGFATWDEFDRALPAEQQGSAFACVDPQGVGPRLFFQRVPEGSAAIRILANPAATSTNGSPSVCAQYRRSQAEDLLDRQASAPGHPRATVRLRLAAWAS